MAVNRTTLETLFGGAGSLYTDIVEQILPRLIRHSYTFITDEFFKAWQDSADFEVGRSNQILALELVDKAHLAATTALFRTMQWTRATCLAYETENFVSWAASARGLVESAGDIVDGLANVPLSLAAARVAIAQALSGRLASMSVGYAEIEHVLDHFVHAKWMRGAKGDVRKAKENVDYVRLLELAEVSNVVEFYHRICGIVHPSSSSIDYLYVLDEKGMRLDIRSERKAIDRVVGEFPKVLCDSLMLACNPPLLILRVLHKFGHHPQLPELKKIDWSEIPVWASIAQSLGHSW